MRAPAELVDAFRERGLKVTPQRQLLFRLLHDNESHPSAEALWSTAAGLMPGISLRTVYQTLNDLVSMGEMRALVIDGGATRFDPNTTDHHHARCAVCGVVRDVYVEHLDALAVHGAEDFRTEGTDLVFHGRCASCADDLPSQPSIRHTVPHKEHQP